MQGGQVLWRRFAARARSRPCPPGVPSEAWRSHGSAGIAAAFRGTLTLVEPQQPVGGGEGGRGSGRGRRANRSRDLPRRGGTLRSARSSGGHEGLGRAPPCGQLCLELSAGLPRWPPPIPPKGARGKAGHEGGPLGAHRCGRCASRAFPSHPCAPPTPCRTASPRRADGTALGGTRLRSEATKTHTGARGKLRGSVACGGWGG